MEYGVGAYLYITQGDGFSLSERSTILSFPPPPDQYEDMRGNGVTCLGEQKLASHGTCHNVWLAVRLAQRPVSYLARVAALSPRMRLWDRIRSAEVTSARMSIFMGNLDANIVWI